ncbi:hypothetical protein [Streptomyces vilmorinianum]|uniref:hypothetical protein n=1 Tax=Streptomyces vilmorinianum TaxID=3051092 RepID=UPI0020C7AD24|nr:hypothetical protein [Streptomyces vilmorinianum]
MRRERVPRRLVVGETVWLWSVGHAHTATRDARGFPVYPDCRELLTLRRADARHAQLRLVFRAGPGRLVPDGLGPSGSIGDRAGRDLNLHEPGVVHGLLAEAEARGLSPVAHGVTEVDGWPLFDALVSGQAHRVPQDQAP